MSTKNALRSTSSITATPSTQRWARTSTQRQRTSAVVVPVQAEQRPSRRRPILLIAGGLAAAALVLPSPVSAAINATASNASSPTAVTSDTVSLTMSDAGASLSQTVAGLLPGDTVGRNLSLVSSGAAARNLTLRVSDSVGSVLSTDATRGLAVSVQSCSSAWSGATCSGTTTPLMTSVPLATLSGGSVLLPTVAPASTTYLRLTLALPNSTETTVDGVLPANTVQNRTAALTYTFSQEQRAAVNS